MDATDLGFVKHWQIAGPMLQRFERDEMRRYTEVERRRDICALLDIPFHAMPSASSGLVDQQRLFRRRQS
ncbi:MAG: hypothetical protein SH868_07350 [Bythopirellula sp.]|nr:hypothetical protein [Bythopirellula sp.]